MQTLHSPRSRTQQIHALGILCRLVHMYISICSTYGVHKYTHTYIYAYVSIRVCICIYIYVCVHVHIILHRYICIYTYIDGLAGPSEHGLGIGLPIQQLHDLSTAGWRFGNSTRTRRGYPTIAVAKGPGRPHLRTLVPKPIPDRVFGN